MDEEIKAGQFKTHCLKVMDKVRRTRRKIVITKRNKPVAKLVPIDEEDTQVFGKLKGSVQILDDITKSFEDEWNANSE